MDLGEQLRREWRDRDNGFFYQARKMTFDESAADRLLNILQQIDTQSCSAVQRKRLVKSIWNLPYFALAYRERCLETGTDERRYDEFRIALDRLVDKKLDELLDGLA